MNKSDLTEQEIRSRYIRPALIDAGWQPAQIREEHYFTSTGSEVEVHWTEWGSREYPIFGSNQYSGSSACFVTTAELLRIIRESGGSYLKLNEASHLPFCAEPFKQHES